MFMYKTDEETWSEAKIHSRMRLKQVKIRKCKSEQFNCRVLCVCVYWFYNKMWLLQTAFIILPYRKYILANEYLLQK